MKWQNYGRLAEFRFTRKFSGLSAASLAATVMVIVIATLISYRQLSVIQSDLRDLSKSNAATSNLLKTVIDKFKVIEQIHYQARFGPKRTKIDHELIESLNNDLVLDYERLRKLTDEPQEIRLNEAWYRHLIEYNLRIAKFEKINTSQTKELQYWNTYLWPEREALIHEVFNLDRYQTFQSTEREERFLKSLDYSKFIAVLLMLIVSATILILGLIAKRMTERHFKSQQQNLLSRIKMDTAIGTANEKAEFLAGMSHEIRTPLNAIIGLTDMLNEDRDPQNKSAYLKALRTSADHLFHLVNNVLDFSKIENNSSALNITQFNLKTAVDRQLNVLANNATKGRVQLTAQLDSELPAHVLGDETKIGQILLNLIGNALKFSEGGQVTLSVCQVKQAEQTTTLKFTVTDTGIGMTKAQVENLFRPYVQAEADTTAKFGGTGLGLVISKKLIEMMDGTISVESKPGTGSSFIFEIPFELPSFAHSTKSEVVADLFDDPEAIELSQLNILVAEDNSTNRLVIASVLRKLKANFTIVEDGGQVLPALDRADFDLILMDCLMPVSDGFQTTELIREFESKQTTRKRIPIIALTASVLDADREKCLSSGMDAFASKPVRAQSLAAIIRETLKKAA